MSFLVPFSSRFYRYFNTFLRFLPFFFYFLSSFFPFSYPVFSFFSVLAFTFTIDPFCFPPGLFRIEIHNIALFSRLFSNSLMNSFFVTSAYSLPFCFSFLCFFCLVCPRNKIRSFSGSLFLDFFLSLNN